MSSAVNGGTDRKDRLPSPTESTSSRGNVVDHSAPNGSSREADFEPILTDGHLSETWCYTVTDDVATTSRAPGEPGKHVIKVQPLKRSEMQVSARKIRAR